MPKLELTRPPNLLGGLISKNAQAQTADNVVMLELDKLDHFFDHPFNLYSKEDLASMAESIKEHGVLEHILVRPKEDSGRYEIISGHNRSDAAKLAGLWEIPAKIMSLNDDEAMVLVTEANLKRRPALLPSEKARVYAMRYEALRRIKKVDEIVPNGHDEEETDLCPLGTEVKSGQAIESIVSDLGESKRNVYRYIKIHNNLMPELMELVDSNEIPFRAAVELTDLTMGQQYGLLELLGEGKYKMSIEAASKIKAEKDNLDESKIIAILSGKSPDATPSEPIAKPQNPVKQISSSFNNLIKSKSKQGFEFDPIEMERVVIAAVETYFNSKSTD